MRHYLTWEKSKILISFGVQLTDRANINTLLAGILQARPSSISGWRLSRYSGSRPIISDMVRNPCRSQHRPPVPLTQNQRASVSAIQAVVPIASSMAIPSGIRATISALPISIRRKPTRRGALGRQSLALRRPSNCKLCSTRARFRLRKSTGTLTLMAASYACLPAVERVSAGYWSMMAWPAGMKAVDGVGVKQQSPRQSPE